MSEYIEIELDQGDNELELSISTNLPLTVDGEVEVYDSPEAMELGSVVAQALAVVSGLETLHLEGGEIIISRDPQVAWHDIVQEITAVLKDFFL